jgi:hypothetical protein
MGNEDLGDAFAHKEKELDILILAQILYKSITKTTDVQLANDHP